MSPESKRWSVFAVTAAILIASVMAGRRGIADPLVARDGKVLILEFSDYQCPACRGAEPILRRMLDYYGDKVRWVHKNFPLEQAHKHARMASRSALCAERQGGFKAWHETLFNRQDAWVKAADPKATILSYAAELKLDPKAMEACMAEPAVDQQISDEYNEGRTYNVRSTPTFFINGTRLLGSQQLSTKGPYLIDKELKARGVEPPSSVSAAKGEGK